MIRLALAVFLSAPALGAPRAIPGALRADVARVSWTPRLTDRLIREMPKVETHLHLDGALTPRLTRELAREQAYAPLADKSLAEIKKLTVVSDPRATLKEVLDVFPVIYPLLQNARAVEKTAYDIVARAKIQNVRYVEVRFAPALQAAEGFSAEQALEAALAGLRRGEKEFGIRSGVIICLIRPYAFVGREKNEEMLRLAVKYYGRGVTAIDLAGNEAAMPLADFKDYFIQARKAGLSATAHAGEVPGSRDLRTALDLGMDRLGHAVLLSRDPALLRRVVELGIPIEVNLTSNLRTGAVARLEDHPVKAWYRAGIPIALSTDDPGIFGVDLNHEYRVLARKLRFSAEDLLAVSFQGIDSLFLPEPEKQTLRREFETELKTILEGFRKGKIK